MIDFFLIIILVSIGLFWSAGMKAREIAMFAVKSHCQKMDVQLLDEYVALNGLWFKRDKIGKLKTWRSYQFEFTSTGNERYNGKVVMLGQFVLSIQLDPHVFQE